VFLPFSNKLIILGGCILICLSTVTFAAVIHWVWHLLAFWTTLPSLLSACWLFLSLNFLLMLGPPVPLQLRIKPISSAKEQKKSLVSFFSVNPSQVNLCFQNLKKKPDHLVLHQLWITYYTSYCHFLTLQRI